ncbi:DUF1440 domain-containing protein [Staphylococcus simulans]|uniref:YagU family protein n=1 Tax=Staphylococcus simulans TaxID=1286 RepID=UPI001E34470D|nr:DUF1440 domain-containing protein [Staphylococcus simulans]MCD8915374.1 DUF1440 domain-containing protein [Staphylococcus simulans]
MHQARNKSTLQFIYTAVIAGLLSGIVKLGWEVMFPPRTPERNATNPPQQLLQQLGFSPDFTHQTYQFSEQMLPWVSFIVHYSFSIVIALIYIYLAKKYSWIYAGYGAVFGIIVLIGFHLVLMPLIQTVPAPWDQPFHEHLSELFGHIVWMMTIELVRRYAIYKDKALKA